MLRVVARRGKSARQMALVPEEAVAVIKEGKKTGSVPVCSIAPRRYY